MEAASSPDSSTPSPPSPPSPESSSQPPPSDNDTSPPSESPPSPSTSPLSPPPSSTPPPSDDTNSSPPPPSDSSNQPPPSQDDDESDDKDRDKDKKSPSAPSGDDTSPSPPASRRSPDSPSREIFSPPPPIDGSTSSDDSSGSLPNLPSRSSLSGASDDKVSIVVGAVVGGAFLLLMLIVCVVCSRRKKKKYTDTPYSWNSPPTGNQYWTNVPPGADHAVKIPPGPGPLGGGPGAGWTQGSALPPHMNYSGDMSSPFTGQTGTSLPPPSPGLSLGFSKSMFTYEELSLATNGFAQSNMLGQGGFGFVHKGILPNGKEVAVKSLKSGSGQGEREFQSEVEIISRVHHRHLVSLVGYCIAGGQRMLVYEFVPNNTLEYHLHKRRDFILDFPTRLRIALGSAKGLAYLHEDCHPRIIHRDIKAANILIDYQFEAQVADFGLAKLTTDTNTHVSTRVMGTFGYLAPEYASSGKLTEKSDVFSFGVMLLELITGRPPVDLANAYMEDSLVDWARPLLTKSLEDGNFKELADPRLELNYDSMEMARMVACAAASIRHSARKRPKMSQIVRALEGDVSLDALDEGVKPGQSTVYGSSAGGSSDYDASTYSTDLKKFRQMAFGSQEFGSSMYTGDGNTSEYGLNPSSSSTSTNSSREMGSRKPH
ncbi:Proline-rich receptor-like protein [Drosera capensis]